MVEQRRKAADEEKVKCDAIAAETAKQTLVVEAKTREVEEQTKATEAKTRVCTTSDCK